MRLAVYNPENGRFQVSSNLDQIGLDGYQKDVHTMLSQNHPLLLLGKMIAPSQQNRSVFLEEAAVAVCHTLQEYQITPMPKSFSDIFQGLKLLYQDPSNHATFAETLLKAYANGEELSKERQFGYYHNLVTTKLMRLLKQDDLEECYDLPLDQALEKYSTLLVKDLVRALVLSDFQSKFDPKLRAKYYPLLLNLIMHARFFDHYEAKIQSLQANHLSVISVSHFASLLSADLHHFYTNLEHFLVQEKPTLDRIIQEVSNLSAALSGDPNWDAWHDNNAARGYLHRPSGEESHYTIDLYHPKLIIDFKYYPSGKLNLLDGAKQVISYAAYDLSFHSQVSEVRLSNSKRRVLRRNPRDPEFDYLLGSTIHNSVDPKQKINPDYYYHPDLRALSDAQYQKMLQLPNFETPNYHYTLRRGLVYQEASPMQATVNAIQNQEYQISVKNLQTSKKTPRANALLEMQARAKVLARLQPKDTPALEVKQTVSKKGRR